MELEIVHCGLYNRPETFVQELIFTHIGVVIGGLDYMNIHTSQGEMLLTLQASALPFLTLFPAGLTIDFRYNRHRENWVIQCRTPALRPAPHHPHSLLKSGIAGEIPVPLILPLSMEQAFAFRERFTRIGELHRDGTPSSIAAAEWMAAGIAGEILAGTNSGRNGSSTPVTRLRALIDADRQFRKTLGELSREAGATPGHLRRLFLEKFQISPGEYRARRRLGRIMELIDRNELGLKEIAAEVGMRNVTHLHAFVRDRCGVTPGELQKQRGKLLSREEL